ncbi:serine/threonine protein kinase [Vibrio sp. 1F279]|uniref:serine/threonine protein kinase n=1 Tax=unclassified Vibrio TaxID=2614977 RepID=UPI00352E1396
MAGKRRRRRNNHKRQKDMMIGPWKLVDTLGHGGNGEVWEVSREGLENHAIKLLKNADAITYERFKAETHVLSTHSIEGMIPLVESNLPEDLKEGVPWFVMPKAIPFAQYAEEKSSMELAKQFVLLGKTLENLHSKGIAHRDIKPANVLFYNDRLCFADFGLVKYPGKENITPEKRDVGAKFTMAPEMRREASLADGMPADVFSLAKSLWIALTKQEKGFDGQYNPSSILSVKNYCDDLYIPS